MRRVCVTVSMVVSCVALSGCVALTDRASHVSAFSAQLNAHGHTDSTPAHYYFQYAETKAALGTSSGAQTPTHGPIPPNYPAGGTDASFGETVTGLQPSTRYYFRVCGGDGQTDSDVCAPTRSFLTRPGVSFATPGVYSWTVPAGVTRAAFDLAGAQGGRASCDQIPGVTVSGGLGAEAAATLAVQPGQTLTVVVGGAGSPEGAGSTGATGGGAPGGAGGQSSGGGGGGGGASDVRSGAGDQSGLATRLLVAGGGGGAGEVANCWGADGGSAGGAGGPDAVQGQDGSADTTGFTTPARGGGGGTASSGGAGGKLGSSSYGPYHDGASGTDGGLGAGGAGGSNTNLDSVPEYGLGGGGGAGGYYGGGGGGSGFWAQPQGGLLIFANGGGGGGGSSFVTPTALCSESNQTGLRSGDGVAEITYNPPRC
jgi:hypothetical protein